MNLGRLKEALPGTAPDTLAATGEFFLPDAAIDNRRDPFPERRPLVVETDQEFRGLPMRHGACVEAVPHHQHVGRVIDHE